MTIWELYLIIVVIIVAGAGFIWLIILIHKLGGASGSIANSFQDAAEREVNKIFTDDFREELKNRGRLYFEKIINDNAEFLKQDLRLTSSQLNEFMKSEIMRKLQEEFAKYEQSINDARDLAIDTIKKTNATLDEQRQFIGDQIKKEIDAEKNRIIALFEQQLKDIVTHYIIAAIGNQINLDDQLEYILEDFETNKNAMIEDLKNAG